MDCANWYGISAPNTKKTQALYPAMGRKHIEFFGQNKLVFAVEPQNIFKTIDFMYVIVGTTVIQVDKFYNEKVLGNVPLGSQVWFDFLPVDNQVFAILTAETVMYLITESPGGGVTFQQITDPNAPTNPLFVVAFGNRFVVSQKDTPDFFLSTVNVAGTPNTIFTIPVLGGPLQARATGVIRQLGVLHNQMYMFCDYVTNIWANIPNQITIAGAPFSFPFKQNSSYSWDYGIADPFTLSIDFGRLVFLAKNASGLVSFMASNGQQPVDISSQAVNVLLENSRNPDEISPFLQGNSDGFIYQYENTILYRVSGGVYKNYRQLDLKEDTIAIEYNFSTGTWARVIELNGERNRIEKHIFFNGVHLVTVQNDGAIYQMAGNLYFNELRTPDVDAQAANAFSKYPMRYELTTEQIFAEDYSEFITDYVEIDFVFGDKTFYRNDAPFDNTIFIITEDSDPACPTYCIAEDQPGGEDVFLIIEEGNTPSFDDNHYNSLFKPNISLYYSDDGGVVFSAADLREFSQLGQYRWRMRWYELGPSRNRCYKLICVSSAPIVVLGAVQNKRRSSGGAN
jgi:hypothetical protein